MSAPCQSACTPWATVADVPEECQDTPDLERWLAVATDVLFELSGRQFPGTCIDVVRPCARWDSWGGVPASALAGLGYTTGGHPYGYRSAWGSCSCNRGRRCGCGSVPEITLGAFPVVAVDEILVDGAVLDPQFYRVDDFRYLVRLPNDDGSNPGWPCCQHVTLDATEPGTWQVTFRYGTMPNSAGVAAAALYACELAKGAAGGECALPEKTRTVVAQGVTVDLGDVTNFADGGFTGIRLTDLWLQSVNPNRLRSRARVIDPSIARRVRRVTTPHG